MPQKELLSHLLNRENEPFKEGLASFFKKYISFHDLTQYAFMPALVDAWLITSQQGLEFELHKFFQPGVLAFDMPTYALVSKKNNLVVIITLNNVYQRDGVAQAEVNDRKRKLDSSSRAKYDEIFKNYEEFSEKTFLGTTPAERAAKAAWVLAHDPTYPEVRNLINGKSITYMGIANVKGHVAIEIEGGIAKIFKQTSDISSFPILTDKIKQALQIKSEEFSSKSLSTNHPLTNQLADLQINKLDFDDTFKRKLEHLLRLHRETSNANFIEANLHGVVVGNFLGCRRELGIVLKSNREGGNGRPDLLIFSKNDPQKQIGLILEFKAKSSALLVSEAESGLNQIIQQKYEAIFDKYCNVSRTKKIAIAASTTEAKIVIKKEPGTTAIAKNNKQSFLTLLAEGNYGALTHNLNFFSLAVLSSHDINKRNPEFLPAFFLGLLLEGTLQGNINFYTQEQTYTTYSFLIESLKDNDKRLILLTNIKKDSPEALSLLSDYSQKVNSLATANNIQQLDFLHINVQGKEIFAEVSTKTISSLPATPTVKTLLDFQKAQLVQTPFFDLLTNLMNSPPLKSYASALETQLKSLLLDNRLKIFPDQANGEAFIHGSVLGLIAESWHKLQALESNGEAGHGRFDLRVTPESHGAKRKQKPEIFPRRLVFEFKKETGANKENLKILANNAIEQIDDSDYGSTLSEFGGRITEAASIGVAVSDSQVVARITPRKIDYSSYETDATPVKKCRNRRSLVGTCTFEGAEIIKNGMKDILNLSKGEMEYFSKVTRELNQALQEEGTDSALLNALEQKISEVYDSFGNTFLENSYRQLNDEDADQTYLRQQKTKINSGLKKWFTLTTLYNVFDNSVALRQVDSLVPTVLMGNDLAESLSNFLGSRFSAYRPTQPLGRFLQKMASNPFSKPLSVAGSLLQLGSSGYLIINSQTEMGDYYWAVRNLQQILTLRFQSIARTYTPLIGLDILYALVWQAHSSHLRVNYYDRILPLTEGERWKIGVRHFFAWGNSDYDQQKGFKEQLELLYQQLKTVLSHTEIRAAVYSVDRLRKETAYFPSLVLARVPTSGANCHEVAAPSTYHIDSKIISIQANLSQLSTEQFLEIQSNYLGNIRNTNECKRHYHGLCYNPPSDFSRTLDDYHRGYNREPILKLTCQLKNGESPAGNDCEKYQQVQQDEKDRTVNVIRGADVVLPTQPSADGSRYLWASAPLGQLTSLGKVCQVLSDLYDPPRCNKTRATKQCDESFTFANAAPFILVDKDKPANGTIVYLNAPKQENVNGTITGLQAGVSNPAIIYVQEGEVHYQGSTKFNNQFVLQQSVAPRGLVEGGEATDRLDAVAVQGRFTLTFLDDSPATISNETLLAVAIETYHGNFTVEEEITVNSCLLRFSDAGGSLAGDKYFADSTLRCSETDQEYRMVYSGDYHELSAFKPIVFDLTSQNFTKTAYLAQPSVTSIYPHTVKLNSYFADLDISRAVDSLLPGSVYEIKNNKKGEEAVLLTSNSYQTLVYQTKDGFHFFLKQRMLSELQQAIQLQKLCRDRQITNGRLRMQIKGLPTLNDLSVVVFYNNTAHHSHAYLETLIGIVHEKNWPIQRLSISNAPIGNIEIGSVYDDYFSTPQERLSYLFRGGEGADNYEILPSDSIFTDTDRVIIDNKALLYTESQGQDILDVSLLEYLRPQLSLKEISSHESTYYKLTNQTVVLHIRYDNLTTKQKNNFRICLKNYRQHEDYRHLYVQLSRYPGSDVLYRIDVNNEQLIPIRYRNPIFSHSEVNTTLSGATTFPVISLISDSTTTIARPINQAEPSDAAQQIHRAHHEVQEPKTIDNKPEANTQGTSYVALGAMIFAPFAFILSVYNYRLKSSVAYSPVTTVATVAATTATTMLLNTIETVAQTYTSSFKAQQTEPLVNKLNAFSKQLPFEYGANYNPADSKDADTSGHDTAFNGELAKAFDNLFSVVSLFIELEQKRNEEKVRKIDFARRATLCQVEEKQTLFDIQCLVNNFFRIIKADVKRRRTITSVDELAEIIVKRLQSEIYKNYFSPFTSQYELKTEVRLCLQNESPAKLQTFLADLFFEKVYQKVKNTGFSNIPELAENQKLAFLSIMPVISNKKGFIDSLSMSSETDYSEIDATRAWEPKKQAKDSYVSSFTGYCYNFFKPSTNKIVTINSKSEDEKSTYTVQI